LTANQHDAIAAVELALAEADRLAGQTDPDDGPTWSRWSGASSAAWGPPSACR
jgi:hypothetical protein